MNIEFIELKEENVNEKNDKNVDKEKLLEDLSNMVVILTDEEIKKKNEVYKEKKNIIAKNKKILKELNNKFKIIFSEVSRQKTLRRILNILETLYKNNIITGSKNKKFIEILNTLSEKPMEKLRKLEESLSVYLPDK